MVEEGIRDGDLLVVDRSVTPSDGDIIVVADDGQLAVRKFQKQRVGVGSQEIWGAVTFSIQAHCKQ